MTPLAGAKELYTFDHKNTCVSVIQMLSFLRRRPVGGPFAFLTHGIGSCRADRCLTSRRVVHDQLFLDGNGHYRSWVRPARTFASRPYRKLNRAIASTESTDEVFSVLARIPKGLSDYAGGNMFDVVTFSTAFHRLAKYGVRERNGVEKVKKDVLFVALVACFAEALAGEMTKNASRQMANTMWALAKLDCLNPNMSICAVGDEESIAQSRALATRLRTLLHHSIMEANGGTVMASPELIQCMAETCDAIMDLLTISFHKSDDHNPQQISNILWAMATARRRYHGIVEHLVGCFVNLSASSEILPQDWSNTIWAVATLGVEGSGESIVKAMAKKALSSERADFVFSSFNGQALANTAWGTATLLVMEQQRTPESKLDAAKPFLVLLGLLKDVIVKRLDGMQDTASFKSQNISNILWAFSTASIPCPDLFDSAANYCLLRHFFNSQKINSQAIGNIFWAFGMQAKLNEESRPIGSDGSTESSRSRAHKLVLGLIDVALEQHSMLEDMETQHLSQMCWGMAAMRVRYDPFLKIATQELRRRLERNNSEVDPQSHSNILWACAILNYSNNVHFVDCTMSLSSWNRQNLANFAWSLAVSRRYDATLTKGIFDAFFRLFETKDQQTFQLSRQLESQLQQLLILDIAMALESPEDHKMVFDSDRMCCDRERLYQFDKGRIMDVTSSSMQEEVSRSFKRIGFDHEEEHMISMADIAIEFGLDIPALDRQVFSVDLACSKSKIAIEFDGPFHFVQMIDVGVDGKEKKVSTTLVPDGSTSMKKRLLERLGWRVITIPYWEWEKMTSRAAKDKYCTSLLKDIGYKRRKRAKNK